MGKKSVKLTRVQARSLMKCSTCMRMKTRREAISKALGIPESELPKPPTQRQVFAAFRRLIQAHRRRLIARGA